MPSVETNRKSAALSFVSLGVPLLSRRKKLNSELALTPAAG
jgi:hypothetical protein